MKHKYNTEQYNSDYLVVKYKVFGEHHVNDFLDRRIEEVANRCGLEFQGSGYNFRTKIRDLSFASTLYEEQIKF